MPKANGFMVYVIEQRDRSGRKISVADAVAKYGGGWKLLSAEQRKVYAELASDTPNIKKKLKEKLTCHGIPVSFVQKMKADEERRINDMRKDIMSSISSAIANEAIREKKFFFIVINYFVSIKSAELYSTPIYIPAEIGLVEFSLEMGVNRKLHILANPNISFYGNLYEATHHSDTTHKLPLPPNSLNSAETKMEKIYVDILEFLLESDGTYAPVYTNENMMETVNSALMFLRTADSKDRDYPELKVYSIQELFFNLKHATAQPNQKPKNLFVTNNLLERDAFEYAEGISCQYHHEIDRSHYCALSQAIRWSFSFADYIGKDLGITLIAGRHFPESSRFKSVALDDESEGALSRTLSRVSLSSNYVSCEDTDQASTVSTANNFTVKVAKAPSVVSSKSSFKTGLFDDSVCEFTNIDRSVLLDESTAPAMHHFSLDRVGDMSALSTGHRGTMGRGNLTMLETNPIFSGRDADLKRE